MPQSYRSIYSTTLNQEQEKSLYEWFYSQSLVRHHVNYAQLAFKWNAVNVVLYNSHKLVVQGKNTEDFIQLILEPLILKQVTIGYDNVLHSEWFEEHAGMDESGKGDLFGPLVTACVIANEEQVKQLISDGIKDSKQVSSDNSIVQLSEKIRRTGCIIETMSVSMAKYNELYIKFHSNMNLLLGWMHTCSLKNALAKKPVSWGMLDQFSKRPIVQSMLKNINFELRMETKAESDPVVAAASIIARAEYLQHMQELSKLADMSLMKGASQRVTEQAIALKERLGQEAMKNFVKLHFKTAP